MSGWPSSAPRTCGWSRSSSSWRRCPGLNSMWKTWPGSSSSGPVSPASRIQEAEFGRLAHLGERLRQRIIGQDKAIDAVTAAIRRNRVGISPKHKPVSFIFVGSTGVGKTELVKQLAQELFHSPDSLIRLDMSEFMEKHSVSRLIGSPPGYVGYDEAGQLTEKNSPQAPTR